MLSLVVLVDGVCCGLQVKVFSRNCEDRSTHFPDVADAIRAAAAGECCTPGVAVQHGSVHGGWTKV